MIANVIFQSVNLECSPSCDPNGLDLPLGDMNTLRFFFNLGVQQSKVLMLASKNNQHTINAEVWLQCTVTMLLSRCK